MQQFRTNITKRKAKAKHRDGQVTVHDRYFLHYNDPATGKRRMVRFKTRKEAESAQNDLIKNFDGLRRATKKVPTLAEAVEYWLTSRAGVVTAHTFKTYNQLARDWIIGPALQGSSSQRRDYGMTKIAPAGSILVPMLGPNVPIDRIKTAEIRTWFLQVRSMATPYVARSARKALSSIFRLIEEDYDIRLARMPTRAAPAHRRQQRLLLTEEQVKLVLEEAQRDKKWGVYYAFAFLTGTRPSEQLGLLWDDVDLIRGRVRIHRAQHLDGSLKPFTKTDAGMREIPLNALLLDLLRDWKARCPEQTGFPHRVFPPLPDDLNRGRKSEKDGNGGLSINNYRNRVWYPMLKRLGLPRVSPYAARHMMISFLQAQGVEIGLVAKIAGHASPKITLQYYTHAVRENDGMMDKLTAAYGLDKASADKQTGVQTQ